jgi:anti-sigma factor RsiW
MEHGFTERQWLEWLDGTLQHSERARLETHVVNCARCSRLSADLRRWDSVVAAEATQLSQAFSVDESAVEKMLEEALERIRESEPSQMPTTPVSRSAVEGTLLLRHLLAPLCGPVTARNAIRVAAERSSELGEPMVTEANWRLFISNLRCTMADVCGAQMGRLIEQVGRKLVVPVC